MLVFTTAPSQYDYGYTTEVDPKVKFKEVIGRIVEIPEEAAEYQMARYLSGLYFTQVVE